MADSIIQSIVNRTAQTVAQANQISQAANKMVNQTARSIGAKIGESSIVKGTTVVKTASGSYVDNYATNKTNVATTNPFTSGQRYTKLITPIDATLKTIDVKQLSNSTTYGSSSGSGFQGKLSTPVASALQVSKTVTVRSANSPNSVISNSVVNIAGKDDNGSSNVVQTSDGNTTTSASTTNQTIAQSVANAITPTTTTTTTTPTTTTPTTTTKTTTTTSTTPTTTKTTTPTTKTTTPTTTKTASTLTSTSNANAMTGLNNDIKNSLSGSGSLSTSDPHLSSISNNIADAIKISSSNNKIGYNNLVSAQKSLQAAQASGVSSSQKSTLLTQAKSSLTAAQKEISSSSLVSSSNKKIVL